MDGAGASGGFAGASSTGQGSAPGTVDATGGGAGSAGGLAAVGGGPGGNAGAPVPECLRDRECPEDAPVCVDRTCEPRPSCLAASDPDAACRAVDQSAPFCTLDGECVQCIDGSDCGDGTVCMAGACEPCPDETMLRDGVCITHQDTPLGRYDHDKDCWWDPGESQPGDCSDLPSIEPLVVEWTCGSLAKLRISPGIELRVTGFFDTSATGISECVLDPTRGCDIDGFQSETRTWTNRSDADEFVYVHRQMNCTRTWTAWWQKAE